MCYYLCVLTWLMRPILALNCLLQIEQDRSEEESSVGDALASSFPLCTFLLGFADSFCFVFTSSPFYEGIYIYIYRRRRPWSDCACAVWSGPSRFPYGMTHFLALRMNWIREEKLHVCFLFQGRLWCVQWSVFPGISISESSSLRFYIYLVSSCEVWLVCNTRILLLQKCFTVR